MCDSRRTPTSCAPSGGNGVKDVRVMVGMARDQTLAAQGAGARK